MGRTASGPSGRVSVFESFPLRTSHAHAQVDEFAPQADGLLRQFAAYAHVGPRPVPVRRRLGAMELLRVESYA
jgi:hypothetical protein